MAADDKRSPTLDSTSDLPHSPSSPSHLTHFKPLTPDQDEPPFKSAYSSFVNLFRFSKAERAEAAQTDSQALSSSWSSPQHPPRAQSLRSPVPYKKQLTGELQRRSSSTLDNRRKVEPPLGGHDPRTAVQLRSLSTVLKRLKEIMEGKSQDSDLKQYWMPDSQCKECYDCSEKFTTFRRRHHCRLCGQIFCSRCCNQEIPGKFMGYTGDLRACTYCRKIALSYAHSTDSNSIGEDLNALSDSACSVSVLDPGEPRTPVGSRKASRNIFLEEDLTWQSLIHPDSSTTTLSACLGSVQEDAGKSPARNRSASITNLSLDRSGSPMVPSYETSVSPQANRTHMKAETSEDERKILLDSVQLKDLWKKICHHNSGMEFQDHRYWLRTHPNCIVGKELVNWLIRNGHITTRVQAIAIGQALVDGRWLDCVSHHDQLFRDEYALYRPLQSTEFSETPSPDSDSVNSVEGHSEPSWFKDIKFDDSDTEQIADEGEDNLANSASPSKRTSVSSFQSTMDSDSAASISLNVEMDNVNFHIKKHSKYPHVPPHPADQKGTSFDMLASEELTAVWCLCLQEREFLKNYVQRIVDVRPNLVLVEKTVSRIAQDMLLEHGITLVINVKPQVLDRVSRMTQGDLVMSMDQLLTKPRLGTCHKFYMQVFQLPYDQTKTLMFFEGCPQHLGCTIKLCGAAEYELARVKEILIFMICVAYHSQLEISFLMDEFAMPPTLTKNSSFHSLIEEPGDENEQQDLFNGEDFSTAIRDVEPSAEKLPVISESVSSDEVTLLEQRGLFERSDQENSQLETMPSKQQEHHKMESSFPVFHSVPPAVPETSLLPLHGIDQHLVTLDSQPLEPLQQADDLQESKNQMRVFRDPLQDDTGLYVTEEVTSSEDRLKTYSAAFKQELKDVILCISPVMVFREPFLLTEKGMRCPAREYFPEQVYWSPLLNKEYKELESRRKRQLLRDLSGLQGMNGSVQAKAIQILPSHELVNTRIAEHLGDSQSLARMLADYRARGGRILQRSTDPFAQGKDVSSVPAGRTGYKIEEDEKGLAQSESSWSHKKSYFNGYLNIHLCITGSSLTSCKSSHYSGEIKTLCFQFQVTPVVPLSSDSWSMSFAKYLELRFYGHQYTRRANAEPCGHSIHHDYHQYFSYNQMVASFSYSPIRLLEVCVPLPKIYIKRQAPLKVTILQDLKDFSQKVSQVYLAVDDRLASLKTDTFSKTREEKMEDLFAQKEMEEGEFRNWTEKIQARLLSSSLDTPQQLQSVFESLIAKKQGLCEMLQAWNSRLQDLFQQEKGRKRPSVPPSPGRLRQGEESKISSMDASPRNASPALQNGEKEDRFLTTLSSQSSAGSTHLQLPTPPEVVSEQLTGANTLSEQDTTSSSEDVFDGHSLGSTDSQVKEKSTMKAILANLLPGNNYNPIPFPFDPDKHYLMYEHERVPIAVCEKEPSSIIAFALSCKEYRNALDELSKASPKNGTEEGLQPSSTSDGKPKSGSPVRLPEANTGPANRAAEMEQPKKPSSVLSFFRGTGGKSPDLSSQKKETLRGADSAYYQVGQMGKEGVENQGAEPQDEVDGGDGQKKQLVNPHVELQFSDANAKFYCRIYYAGEFHKMREVILGSSEEDFIRSLSHSMPWQARGGKSGAAFYVTEDDRFILKQMPRLEVQSFLDFAPHYFTYITNAVQQKKPTALAKILGVYRIGYKNSQNNTEKKLDLLVMENLFYGRKMAQVFDLKGSLRNRNVKTDTGKESCDVVLLDENLLKMVRDNPLYIRSHCKAVLRASIHSDSQFLSSHLIIDYSLLVGRDDTSNELVVGIIDYIRTFTWDKKLEMVVKSTGILGGQGKMPTVVSPELYRTRFCEAMDKYFLMVPDHWTGLGLNC
uniref:1-phosphatidylinositol 3-phosphate 5-kinase n=1 Tax=Pavo cristatus TaxID=9049 RepID=A0A8C9EQP9_PAVCR